MKYIIRAAGATALTRTSWAAELDDPKQAATYAEAKRRGVTEEDLRSFTDFLAHLDAFVVDPRQSESAMFLTLGLECLAAKGASGDVSSY